MQNLKESWFVAGKKTGIWAIFMQAVESLKICTLIRSFCPKYIKIYKKYRRVCLMTVKSDAKFEEKLTLGSRNDMRNWVNLIMQAVASLKNFTLIGYFCRKYVMLEPKKYRGCVVKNDLWFQKWHQSFGKCSHK